MSIDKRFALITDTGEVRYPYVKHQKATGRTGFALTTVGNRDRRGGGEYTMDLSVVIQRVVFDGWSVRAKVPGGEGKAVGLDKKIVQAYWVAPEFRELVKGAPSGPLQRLPGEVQAQGQAGTSVAREEPLTTVDPLEPSPPSTFEALAAAAEIDNDESVRNVPETVRQALINARIGQGGYRRRMLAIWDGRCALSGVGVPEVLVASHAKSWADSSNEERLDEYNGILLAGSFDKLFDAGLISFGDDGQLLRSSGLKASELLAMGCPEAMTLRHVHLRHRPYLQHHRQRYGFK